MGGPVVGEDLFVAADAFVDLGACFAVEYPEPVAFGPPSLQALLGPLDVLGLARELAAPQFCGFDLGREGGEQLLEAPAAGGELGVGQIAQRLV